MTLNLLFFPLCPCFLVLTHSLILENTLLSHPVDDEDDLGHDLDDDLDDDLEHDLEEDDDDLEHDLECDLEDDDFEDLHLDEDEQDESSLRFEKLVLWYLELGVLHDSLKLERTLETLLSEHEDPVHLPPFILPQPPLRLHFPLEDDEDDEEDDDEHDDEDEDDDEHDDDEEDDDDEEEDEEDEEDELLSSQIESGP